MYLREAPFNLQRASLCAIECSKAMTEIEAIQMQAISRVKSRISLECASGSDWFSSSTEQCK